MDVQLSAEGERLRVNAPKGTITAALREQLAGHKAEILHFLRNTRAVARFAPPPIRRRVTDEASPVSFAQERLWFLDQLEPDSSVYNICRAARLAGPLSVETLELSLNEIVRRHSVLRSVFDVVDGRLVQRTVREQKLSISLIDLSRQSHTELEGEITRLVRDKARRSFNLSARPLLRVTLLRLAESDHILILTMHHIVSDAWSMGILTRELWMLYASYADGRPSPLQDLPVQYADYAVWQRQWLEGEVLDSQLSYWKKQLENIPMLHLPADRPRSAQQSYRGARQPISLPESLTAAVNALSRHEGVTPFMTLLAAFQTLLYRCSGQEDVVVASPIANRHRREVEELIGFFVNTLVLRTDCSGNPTFRQLLYRVRDVCLGAYSHQDLPFEKLVEELQPQRELSRNPLFQVMFVLQNTPRPALKVSGLNFQQIEIDNGSSPFDLSLYLRERDGKFLGFFEYSTDLLDRSTMERMAGHFETLLKGSVADPDETISTLPLLTEAERHKLVVEWNDTRTDYPKDSRIHELFEEAVERKPCDIAVQFENRQLTYGELNRRANRLADRLRSFGIGPYNLVGICVEPSLEMVEGLLGILKAGAAYVPLDPAYPRERLAFMAKDSQLTAVITQKKLVHHLPYYGGLTICLDDWDLLTQESDDNPKSPVKADGAAYVIYTSGSTGAPKGVVGLHRGAVNRFAWMWSAYPFEPNERSCVKTSLSFVDSVWEVFGPLLNGTPSVIVPEQAAKDPQLLIQTLADHRVTRIVVVPSLLKAMLDADPNLQTRLPDLRLWSSSGEPLSKELVQRFHRCLPNSRLVNLYGSSEVSADATYHETCKTISSGSIPVGRPIDNTQTYLLDSHLQPVPIGISGEIYVGGAGLASAYLNRPDLTAERFIPNIFSTEPGSRLYRTGDQARYLSDGNIEFLGRFDTQVKIRGCRVEPGEVEAVLNQHPAVRQSIVAAQQGASSPERDLVAYVVSADQSMPPANQLRSFLKDKLPEFMVPFIFVPLQTLPLLPNGKVDREALPLPDAARLKLNDGFIGPRTEAEQLVAQVWKEVLKVEKVGVHDNFFELGGHSLLGTQVVARLRDAFRTEIPLRFLFEAATVADLTQKIETANGQDIDLSFPPIVQISREGYLPLSISQEQLWDFDQMIPGNHLLNIPYVFHLMGTLNTRALADALREIIRRHEVLRTVFAKVDGRPVQVIRLVPEFQMPLIDLRNLEVEKMEEQAAVLTLEERTQPFDLSAGPLLRMKLVRLTDEDYLLLVTLHHIVGDRWSMLVLRRELADLYEAFAQGRPSPLSDLSIQFADFASWERRLMESELMHAQLAYWRNQLAAPLPKLQFQKRRGRNKRHRFQTGHKRITVESNLFTALKALAKAENCTPFMVVLTALNVALHIHTRQQDIRVGTLVANRRPRETENLIGYFVNAVVLRTRLEPVMTWKKLLKHVREVTLGAYAHQELPFGRLAHVLQEEGSVKGDSLLPVLLNYQNVAFPTPDFAGLKFAVLDFQEAKLDSEMALTAVDLIFDLRETPTKLTGSVNYQIGNFGDRGLARLMQTFQKALETMVATPSQAICDALKGASARVKQLSS